MSYERFNNDRYDWSKWLNSCFPTDGEFIFVTLSMKQGLQGEEGSVSYLTKEASDNNVHWFLRQMNRAAYGNAARKYGKKLRVIDSAEGGPGTLKRSHRHLLIEKPSHLTFSQFSIFLRENWLKSVWAYRDMDIQMAQSRSAVIGYITKTGGASICLTNTSL